MQYQDPVLEGAERTVDRSIRSNPGFFRRIGQYTSSHAKRYVNALGKYAAIVGLATTLAVSGVTQQIARPVTQNPDQGIAYAQEKRTLVFKSPLGYSTVTITYPTDTEEQKIVALGNWITNDMTPKVLEFIQYPRYPGRQQSWERPYTIDIDSSNGLPRTLLRDRTILIQPRILGIPNSVLAHEYTHLATESGNHFLPEGLARLAEYLYFKGDPHAFVARSRLVSLTELSNASENEYIGPKRFQGASFIRFLVETYGGMQKFMKFFLHGGPRWNYEKFYGKTLEQLEQEWILFLKEKYAAGN